MGEVRKGAVRLDFDRRLKLESHGTKITSDARLLAYRELDEALGLTSAIDSELRDIRTGKNTQHSIAALLRDNEAQDQGLSKKWHNAGFLAILADLTTRTAGWTPGTIEARWSIMVSCDI